MRALRLALLAVPLLFVFACDSDDDGGDTTQAPDPPTITAPGSGVFVVSPLAVAGTAEADAKVDCSVVDATSVAGTGTATAAATGAWSMSLTYTDAARDATINLSCTQTVGDLTSDPRVVALTQGGAPDPPTIVAPVANAEVASPLWVEVNGDAGNDVEVKVLDGATSIGNKVGVLDGQGAFGASVTYTPPSVGTSLVVQVVQANASGTSDPAEVTVSHKPRTISGTVNQMDGDTRGTDVFVRVYASATEVVDFVDERKLTVGDGVSASGLGYSFEVSPGTYFVRAFRDSDSTQGAGPDGWPTVPIDAQAPAEEIDVSSADASGVDLTLKDPGQAPRYFGFDAGTMHDSSEEEPPYYYDPNKDDWLEGVGVCRGYYLRANVFLQGQPAEMSDPRVKHPSGEWVTLLDDGGCGDKANNSTNSFDDQAGDKAYSYGWLAPTAAAAGDFVLSYRVIQGDLAHAEVDTLASVVKLARKVPLTSPTGAAAAGTTPMLDWADVAGAGGYTVNLSRDNQDNQHSGFITDSNWTITTPLTDVTAYRVSLEVFDVDPESGADVDARSHTISSHFIVDAAGTNTVSVSGDIDNQTGETGPFHVSVHNGDRDTLATLVLPSDSTSYAIRTLKKGQSDRDGFVVLYMDVDGSGDRTETNKQYERGEEIDHSADVTQDMVISAPLLLDAPADGATGVGDSPTFTWQDYSAHAPTTAWLYGVFVQKANAQSDFPDGIWAVPQSTTSFDMAMKPAASFDAIWAFNCAEGGGDIGTDGSCTGASGTIATSPPDLSGESTWNWGVVILECDWATKGQDGDSNDNDDLWDCLAQAFAGSGVYAMSSESSFSTQ